MFPLLLYSEIHFRFGGLSPSLLFKKEPEIIFDLPARCAPGKPLFLTLLLHDIHRFPLVCISVEISLSQSNLTSTLSLSDLTPYRIEHPHDAVCHAYSIPLDISDFPRDCFLTVLPKLTYQCGKKMRSCISDNLPGNHSHPLRCFLAEHALPKQDTTLYLDMHSHSLHTRDHVEFGAPLQFLVNSARSFGLDGALVIDHSYDLSCRMEEYLKRDDQELTNWHTQQRHLLDEEGLIILRGEELSVRKEQGGVVHLGIWGHTHFIPGTGDGARFGYNRSTEPTLSQAVNQLHKDGGFCFAAHPGEKTHFLHRLFLRRDAWSITDFSVSIDALQAVNRDFGVSWSRAKKLWISLLAQGQRIPIIAGNDAHGDFNRYRALKIPFLSLSEDLMRFFGHMRTGFYLRKLNAQSQDITEAISQGRTFITSGPFVDLQYDQLSVVGTCTNQPLSVSVTSTPEYGIIEKVTIFVGFRDTKKERPFSLPLPVYSLHFVDDLPTKWYAHALYIRAEIQTRVGRNGFQNYAATSPVYRLNTSE